MTLPNQLSTLRIILTPLFVLAFWTENIFMNYASFVLFVIASLTDYYDGILARRQGATSIWGRFLDPLADKILISTALLTFAIFGYVKLWMVFIIIIRDALITGLRSYALFKGKSIVTSYLAKAKTFSQVTTIYLIFIFILAKKTILLRHDSSIIIDKIESYNLIHMAMLFVTLLTIISGFKYLLENRAHLKSMFLDFYRVFVPSDL